jgi:type VI protein secretion system component Hcp
MADGASWFIKFPNATGKVASTGYIAQCKMDGLNMSVFSSATCTPGQGINSSVTPSFSEITFSLQEDSAVNSLYSSVVQGNYYDTVTITGVVTKGQTTTTFATITLTTVYVSSLSCKVNSSGSFSIPSISVVFEQIEFEYKTDMDGNYVSQGSVTYNIAKQEAS